MSRDGGVRQIPIDHEAVVLVLRAKERRIAGDREPQRIVRGWFDSERSLDDVRDAELAQLIEELVARRQEMRHGRHTSFPRQHARIDEIRSYRLTLSLPTHRAEQ